MTKCPHQRKSKIIICGGKAQKSAETLAVLAGDLAKNPRLHRKAVRALEALDHAATEIGLELTGDSAGQGSSSARTNEGEF